MVEHNPDLNPSLDEIESCAAVAARFWLLEAESLAEEINNAKCAPAAVVGFTIAAAIQYQAERHVDAAERIAAGLRDLASAIRERKQATEGGAS